jgi:4-aminobutyrate aminotransferase-like enzyme
VTWETLSVLVLFTYAMSGFDMDRVDRPGQPSSGNAVTDSRQSGFRLDRNLCRSYPVVVSGKGTHLFTKDGRTVFDATSGAAVSCLGHGDERVLNAMRDQLSTGIPYLATTFWGSDVVDALCKELINGTDGKMARVYLTGSGMLRMACLVGATDNVS